jgi:uncharacterized protein YndB with AHSA1/START domain
MASTSLRRWREPARRPKAWIDPALFAQWFGPKAWTVQRCEVDAHVGGAWRAWFRRGDGSEIYAGGSYLEIEPPSRLAFTWELDPAGSAGQLASVVTVTFDQTATDTEITIVHRKLGSAQAVDMDIGWTNTLDSLAAFASTRILQETRNDQ